MKPPALSLVPELEALLAFPYDKLAREEIASSIGWKVDTVTRAMDRGDMPCLVLNGPGEGRDKRPGACSARRKSRRASKAAVIQWLWRNLRGDKGLWREHLRAAWPALLELLERDCPAFQLVSPEPCAEAKKKIIPHPSAAKRREPVAFPDHPELRLLA